MPAVCCVSWFAARPGAAAAAVGDADIMCDMRVKSTGQAGRCLVMDSAMVGKAVAGGVAGSAARATLAAGTWLPAGKRGPMGTAEP